VALIVADTDVLIDALRGREPTATLVTSLIRAGGIATTAVSKFELLSGARAARARKQIDLLLAPMPIFDFDESAAAAAAIARLELEANGTPIGMADYLIAGICVARSAALLTRNRAHFSRISELRLADLDRT
jgi:tRNA(fMet)-specific endonuclease VapC